MTGIRGRFRTRPRLLVALLTVGLVLGAAAPAQAWGGPGRAHHGKPVSADIVDSTGQGGQTVALTFDDGPNPQDTPVLLDVLREHRVTAVFCLWGDHVRQHPGIVRRIVAEGHTLCNHSMYHDDMGSWSAEDIRADLRETNAAIREAVPHARIPYFRAPYGSWGETPEVAADMGMRPLGWAMDIADWEPPGTDELIRRLEEGVTPGAVILLHDGGGDRGQTVAAVDHVIAEWKADGWRFTLPEGPRGHRWPPGHRWPGRWW